MPGDPLKKVQPGQRLQIPAEAFNAFLDASRYVRARQHNNESEPGDEFRQTGIVKVRNVTGQDQQRYSVLALQDPIIGPADNLREFKNRVNFDGDVPDDPPLSGRYAVLLEPLAKDAIGRGIVAGVTPVRLRVNPAQLYDFAEVQAGETGALRNVPHGSARVLWVEETGSTERWAVVRLDDGDYQAHVLITSNAPDDDGYYPGVVQRYDVDTKTWQTLFECKVVDINQ